MGQVESSQFWQAMYEAGTPPWDKGRAAPPLVRSLRQWPLAGGAKVLVPGCGFGHEALYLVDQGYAVTAVDFAAGAVDELRRRRGGRAIEALQSDIFALRPAWEACFDRVVEHTCFCAIAPSRRDDYAALMHALLRPGGDLLGLFFEVPDADGPPFCTTRGDIEKHFGPLFELDHIERPPDSFADRKGVEWLARLVRREGQSDRCD